MMAIFLFSALLSLFLVKGLALGAVLLYMIA